MGQKENLREISRHSELNKIKMQYMPKFVDTAKAMLKRHLWH